MLSDLRAQQETLRHLTRTDPDPRVRRRAHALLLLTEGHSVVAVARLFETAPHRVRAWRSRFLASGRQGLADEPRSGRPPKLDATALAFLGEALEAGPQVYGLPVTIWSIRDLRAVLAHRLGVRVCATTVHRAVQRLGYRYRRPRHDLTHRQDHEAVAATTEVLVWLRKKH
jgi:putative transposase